MLSELGGCRTFADLAALLRVEEAKLRHFVYIRRSRNNYKLRPFQKKNGTWRLLAIPHSTLKMIQRRLDAELGKIYRPSSRAFAYIKGRDIRGNAALHLRHRAVFSIDLTDFFAQINFARIRGRLMAQPYNLTNSVATAIARLTTCNNQLPFGAPTSPVLKLLHALCRRYRVQHTEKPVCPADRAAC